MGTPQAGGPLPHTEHIDSEVKEAWMQQKMSENAAAALRRFPVEDIVQHPLPGYVAPSALAFSPDDSLISYLFSPEGTLSRKLYSFHPETSKHKILVTPPGGGVDEGNISTVEKLRRERLRERGLGVTRYDWSKTGSVARILVPLPAGIYVQDGPGADLRLLVKASPGLPILDPQISPDGSMVAYVREDRLWVVPTSDGEPRQLTFECKESGKTHGLAEYIAQEEMERRHGFWWSPDSCQLAFACVDPAHVPLFRIMHQGKPNPLGAEAEEDHHYPFAGQANVQVRLGVVGVAPGEGGVTWMDVDCGGAHPREGEEYLARVCWTSSSSLVAQVQNRTQTRLKLLRLDVASGQRSTLFVEENDTWVNLHDCFTPLQKTPKKNPKVAPNDPNSPQHWRPDINEPETVEIDLENPENDSQTTPGKGPKKSGQWEGGGGFVWASERSGFRHLYLYNASGACEGPLTAGEWTVEQVVGVDEDRGLLYFTGTKDGPLETHLYRAPLSPGRTHTPDPPERLTREKGRHLVVLDRQMRRFVDVFDSLARPPGVALRSLEDGRQLASLYEASSPRQLASTNERLRRLQLSPPEIVAVEGSHGFPLYGALYRPDPSVHGSAPYRTVVSVYGGPHVQTVANTWLTTVDMRAQYLRSQGILVWKLDNRGSSRRGLRFEGAIKRKMGGVELEDQESGVRWLINKGLADPTRIGIYGWSYGGYMAAMALAKCPLLFRCAVSGAPVTAWDGYDTHYTERYMGLPNENAVGYVESSVVHHVHGIQGRLMLVHGMIDENVHFRHTARLINALTAAAKEYELLVFPDERHMPRGLRDRMYMEERIFEFLVRNLK